MDKTVIAQNVEKLKADLLCGIRPDALDPSISAAVDMAARLLSVFRGKGDKDLAGMSATDLSKALMNAVKALDGLARLRSFAAGGPDQRPEMQPFILKVIAPGAEAGDGDA